MHAPYDRSRKSGYRGKPKEGLGFLLLPTIVAFVLITLIVVYPKSSVWISQAVEAELGGGIAEDIAVPTAQPGMAMRTVDAH